MGLLSWIAAGAASYATFKALQRAGTDPADGSQTAPADDSASGTGALLDAGVASFYNARVGALTANGEGFDPNAMTAAHKTLAFGTVCEVINLDNGASIEVRINDRGPFVSGRVIDLTPAGADALGFRSQGLANVEVRAVA